VLLFRQCRKRSAPKPFAQTMARATLKTQEILAKKWALLRTSPNGPRAVFAGFLCVFKFTGSAAARLGGLARCFEQIFFVGINVFWSLMCKFRIILTFIPGY
ncbi:MAG: hypothetical protein KG029_19390, partial [Bacteroidetes bacterium]|nr:hypothetical protein [Bacteroidota bacterium]